MTVQQKAFKSRRRYNQWVTNQTLEDFALRYTPVSARRWSAKRVVMTALSAITFLALEAIGGALTLGGVILSERWSTPLGKSRPVEIR